MLKPSGLDASGGLQTGSGSYQIAEGVDKVRDGWLAA